MPGEDQKIISMSAGFGLRDNGNPGTDCKSAPFFGIALGGGTNQAAVEPKNLQQGVAFGGCPVQGDLLVSLTLAFDIGAQPLANSADAAAELGIRLRLGEIGKVFFGAQGFDPLLPGGDRSGGAIAVDDVHAQAAAIHVVSFGVSNDQAVALQQRFQGGQRVILQMFVANRIEGVARENLGQVMHFDNPDAFLVQETGYVGNERVRVFKIVEHSNRSDDAELFPMHRLSREEIVHDAVGSDGSFRQQIFGRLETNAPDSFDVVRTKQGSVVAADVEDAIAAIQARKSRGFSGDVREGPAHGGADS